MSPPTAIPEFAFYHPWPPLDADHRLSEWAKTMLLFFDGVAVLTPPEMQDRLYVNNEETLIPMVERGLLKPLDPARLIQRAEAIGIVDFLTAAVDALEGRPVRQSDEWLDSALGAAIRGRSVSRYAPEGEVFADRSTRYFRADPRVAYTARVLWDALQRHGVASQPDAEETIRVHPTFWTLFEAFLAHALHDAGLREGLDLRPATDKQNHIHMQNRILNVSGHPSSGHVVIFDLEHVSLDLSRFPIEDVLEFREHHGAEFRKYAVDLQKFAMLASSTVGDERRQILEDRYEALSDAAEELKRISRTWWRRPAASVGLGIAGATFSALKGEWGEAIVALLGGVAGAAGKPKLNSAFTYLFHAERTFAR